MTVTIELSDEQAASLEAYAQAEGLSVPELLERLAEERSNERDRAAKSDVASKTLLELFEPIRGLELDFSRNPSTGRAVDL